LGDYYGQACVALRAGRLLGTFYSAFLLYVAKEAPLLR
jgi:hypothetical protein